MAEFDNISEINENFNTIKTLLNSIRAQGILNTSDVDKLLSGINLKLEKLNTEEDIDLIKIFLTELKQNLDERHGVLVSKFGAIESLFTNLLKNSSEMMKTSEIKELFDIVATNLSVFSREVVAQKETLTDINLRLDAFRTDDSREKNIIKNIALLKPDLERLNSGFDSIVLSLNDNFKALVKTVTSIDKTEYLDRFADNFTSIETASNMVVSIAQILDKKTSAIEDYIKNVATKDDIDNTNKKLVELTASGQELYAAFEDLNLHCRRFDVLGDKIDASVEIVVGLKAMLQEQQDSQAQTLAKGLDAIIQRIVGANTEEDFKSVKNNLELALNAINENKHLAGINKSDILDRITKLSDLVMSLDIDNRLSDVKTTITTSGNEIKEHINDISQKNNMIHDAHVSKILNDITTNADSLDAKLSQTQNSIAMICEKNFGSLFENVNVLKNLLSQIEENSVSANNAIFSNITDRLLAFEKSLKETFDAQQQIVYGTSGKLDMQIDAIKNLSNVFDGKFNTAIIEIANVKQDFEPLKKGINDVLALDFVNVIKDLRVDLYASKQDIENNIESAATNVEDKVAEDLLNKFQSLVTKLEITEDTLKKVHFTSFSEMKVLLENISSSIVDVLSYVSEDRNKSAMEFSDKLDSIVSNLKGDSISYVERVRDVVDVVRIQLENNLKNLEEEVYNRIDTINQGLVSVNNNIRSDIDNSYKKLLEIQDNYNEIKNIAESTSSNAQKNLAVVLSASDGIKNELFEKIDGVKGALSEKITDFKQEFTCANADTISEIRFSLDNSNTKTMEEIRVLLGEVNNNFTNASKAGAKQRTEALTQILDNFTNLKELFIKLDNATSNGLTNSTNSLIEAFKELKLSVDKIDENVDSDMSRQLSIIESNFETLISQITILFEKEGNSLTEVISNRFSGLNDEMSVSIEAKLEDYRQKSELILDDLSKKTNVQAEYIRSQVLELNNVMKAALETQVSNNAEQFGQLAENIRNIIEANREFSQQDYAEIKDLFEKLGDLVQTNSNEVTESYLSKLDKLSELLNSYKSELTESGDNLISSMQMRINSIIDQNDKLSSVTENVSSRLLTLQNSCEYNNNELLDLKREITAKLDNFSQQESELTGSLIEKLDEITIKDIDSKEQIMSNIDVISTTAKQNRENILSKLDSISELADQNINDIKSKLDNIFGSESAQVSEVISVLGNLKQENSDNILKISDKLDRIANISSEDKEQIIAKLNAFELSQINIREDLSVILSDLKEQILPEFDSVKNVCTQNSSKLDSFTRVSDENTSKISSKLDNLAEMELRGQEKAEQKLDDILSLDAEEKNIINTGMLKLSGMLENVINKNLDINDLLTTNSVRVSDILEKTVENQDLLAEMAGRIYDSQEIVSSNANSLIVQINQNNEELKNSISESVNSLLNSISDSKYAITTLNDSIVQKISDIRGTSDGEIADVTSCINDISKLVESQKNEILSVKTILNDFSANEFKELATSVEKETDVVVAELTEQFELLRKSQNDDLMSLTSKVEDMLSSYIYSSVEDLKSYFDIKSDTSIVDSKFGALAVDMSEYATKVLENIDKLLDKDRFKTSFDDFKVANEVLLNTLINGLQDKLEDFLKNNTNSILALSSTGFKNVENKISVFDKNLKDILSDKYEEIKIISISQNELLENFKSEISASLSTLANEHLRTEESIKEVIAAIEDSQISTKQCFNDLAASVVDVHSEIEEKHNDICNKFADLKSQIMNRDFDEAFQTSISTEVKSIEALIDNQLGYLQDISDLCVENLPNLAELFSLVKHSLLKSVEQFSDKLDNQDIESVINKDLKEFKSEIITQFINVFNQISFAAEQDEILDFIQEKHDNLISILSHIVTTSDEIKNIKNDITSINEKISQILSSNGEFDYIYSLQELESDIANLRIVLNDMRDSKAAEDLKNLTASTDEIYKLIETVKEQLPLKSDINDMSENLLSISTRTNKLLLASDESYQTLKDNLQEFKLVIDDLDERTRNFHHESGLDKIDAKLNALNSMVQNGAQTNQVFNQIFEYLAEWVDNAGVQISEISDKVETLDDIGQIKVMLQDLKAEAEDDSQGAELAEALGTVFEKQTKRISSLEAKLDKIIVETTINNKNNKIDMTPMEETLNRFLVAMESRMSSQQDKINALESKLEDVMGKIGETETTELTKKVGGMDRHITKLNKTIEKIASHVIEK